MKTTLAFCGLFLGFQQSAMASDVVYAPGFCEPSALTLFITNNTAEPQRVWTQVRFDEELKEIPYDLDSHSQIKIRGSQFLAAKTGFSLKSWNPNTLQITASCEESLSIPLSRLTSAQVSHYLPSAVSSVKIHLLNLFLKSQNVVLKAFNKAGVLVEKKELSLEKYYDTQTLKWSFSENVARIDVEAQERINSVITYDLAGVEKLSPAMALKPVTLPTDTEKTYFLVSTKEARPEESFVIALQDPQMIATAREQIRNPSLEKIVVAGIELGHGGFNRAFSARDKSPYSWSVNRVDAFADFAHIDCDGSPDLTEERLLQKLNEGGRICFWRYRVVKELSAEEVSSGKLAKP